MTSRLFTVEYDAEGEKVELHLNRAGAHFLMEQLQTLSRGGDADAQLFSGEWGGEELSGEPQGEGNALIHHLKIMFWDDES